MAEEAIVMMVESDQLAHHRHFLTVLILTLRSAWIGSVQHVDQLGDQVLAFQLDQGLTGPPGAGRPWVLEAGDENLRVFPGVAFLEGLDSRPMDSGLR